MKVLIIEDDPDIADFIKASLESENFTVDISHDGEDGSYKSRVNNYDLIVLDYSLPKKNGLAICSEIRTHGIHAPIIFLSVIGDSRIKTRALEAGADDYMTKPFSFQELHARIRAIMRRPSKMESPTIQVGELVIDMQKQAAYRNNAPIYLTRKEFSLLEYLMKNPGSVVSRAMIMEHVWNAESDPFSNTVEAHILNLRKKINMGNQRDLIRNIPGRGYTIDA